MKTFSTTIVVFMVFSVFLLTLATTTPQHTDGAEYAYSALTNSILHPPGYPYFQKINYFLLKIFSPENAYAFLAKISVLYFALSAALIYASVLIIKQSYLLAFASSLAWILYLPALKSATDLEVFSLQYLFLSVLLFCFASLIKNKNNKLLYAIIAGVAFGLASAHHQTIILISPIFFLLFKFKDFLFFIITAVFIGITGYLVMIGFSSSTAYSSIDSFQALFRHIFRLDYGTFNLHNLSDSSSYNYFYDFIKSQFLMFPALLIANFAALVIAFRKREELGHGIFFSLILSLYFAKQLVMPEHDVIYTEIVERFFGIISFTSLFAFIYLLKFLPNRYNLPLIALIAIPALIALPNTIRSADASKDQVVDYELRQILEELPIGSIYISNLDRVGMGLYYYQKQYNLRPDIYLIHGPLFNNLNYKAALKKQYSNPVFKEIVDTVSAKELMAIASNNEMRVFSYQDANFDSNYLPVPYGITWELTPKDKIINLKIIAESILRYCQTIPEDIFKLPEEREISNRVVDVVILAPFHSLANSPNEIASNIFSVLVEKFAAEREGKKSEYKLFCTNALRS